jgi:hypothetical protein
MERTWHRLTVELLALLILGISSRVYAGSGTEAAAFLDIPVGAGPAAMGSAYTALADNAYASVWNPGALGFVDSPQFAGQHLSYLESINDEYLGAAIPFDHSGRAMGVSAQYLGTGKITQTDITGANTGSFNSDYGAYSVSYGQKLRENLGLGVTGKWINAKLSDTSANAYAGDIGLLYKPESHWRLGATVTNLGTKLTFIDQNDRLPSAFHVATAYQPNNQWTVTGEVLRSWPEDRFDGRAGLEFKPMDAVALRTGYRSDTVTQNTALAGFSVGLGLQMWGQEFSYAWVPYGDLGDTQYFSLLIRFGHPGTLKGNMQKAEFIHRYHEKNLTDKDDVEYMQLMQLLNEDDLKTAQGPAVGETVR